MQINLSSQEIITLYTLLYKRSKKLTKKSISDNDIELNNVFLKLKKIIINSLSSAENDNINKNLENWLQKQNSKIQKLESNK